MTDRASSSEPFSFDISAIAPAFADGLMHGSPVDKALDRLLAETGSRAAGLWKATDEFLLQVAFRAVPDMPAEVREEFRRITTRLPLARVDLGVVKAAVTRQPVPAYREAQTGELAGSATWLERFACQQSLAVPIFSSGELRGVIAISTPEVFNAESDTWKQMVELARAIGAHDIRE